MSTILLIILLIALAIYVSSNNTITVAGIQKNTLYSNISTKEQEIKMINIALNDDIVKSYLDNKTVSINDVNTSEQYVLFYIGDTSGGWQKLLVGVDSMRNTTMYTYLAFMYGSSVNPQANDPDKEARMINIALGDKYVNTLLKNQCYIVKSVDLQSVVYLGIGAPYYLHQIAVGVDLANGKTAYISDMGNLTPPIVGPPM